MKYIILNKDYTLANHQLHDSITECEKFIKFLPFKERDKYIIALVTPRVKVEVARTLVKTEIK